MKPTLERPKTTKKW